MSILSAIWAQTALAGPTESRITFLSDGQEVVATLSVPNGDPAPTVLLFHGFTGDRDELKTDHVPEGVFARAARALAESGYASLRIDFRGSGESLSDLSFADTTFEGQVNDGLAAIGYLQGLDAVDGSNIHIIGWSQGGLVASAVAGRSSAPKAVALWNAVADPTQTFGAILGTDKIAEGIAADADQEIPVALPWGAEIKLNGAFFDGLESFDPPAELAAYVGPVMVAQGSLDTAVDPATAQLFVDAHKGETTFWDAEMDHVFNVFGSDETLDQLITETIAFFQSANG
ncbi:MAG: alpha/beta fold hydrolase [Pseudomonadota bacterium]